MQQRRKSMRHPIQYKVSTKGVSGLMISCFGRYSTSPKFLRATAIEWWLLGLGGRTGPPDHRRRISLSLSLERRNENRIRCPKQANSGKCIPVPVLNNIFRILGLTEWVRFCPKGTYLRIYDMFSAILCVLWRKWWKPHPMSSTLILQLK
jgi:hypothetical protein